MSNAVKSIVAGAVVEAIKNSVSRNVPPMDWGGAEQVADRVTKEVTSVVVNATNSEPWYQSRVTWGAIIAVAGGIAGIAGYAVEAEDQAQVVNGIVGVVTAVGGLIAWYGRWRAKKPLGE